MAKPVIKWVGGKTQLIAEIDNRLPEYIKSNKPYQFVEVFAGSGAVSFHLLDSANPPTRVVLNDINQDLINLYEVIQNHPNELIACLTAYQKDYDALTDKASKQPYYYNKRNEFNSKCADSVTHAAIFIFLNKTGFNGLYRVNRKGEFNVPIGSYVQPKFALAEAILTASTLLANTTITSTSFENVLDKAMDTIDPNIPTFFYLDPPYKPLTQSSSFTAYAKDGFTDDDQVRLCEFCHMLDKLGYQWLLSNSDALIDNSSESYFDALYSGFVVRRVKANRNINSRGDKRGKVNELLISNYD